MARVERRGIGCVSVDSRHDLYVWPYEGDLGEGGCDRVVRLSVEGDWHSVPLFSNKKVTELLLELVEDGGKNNGGLGSLGDSAGDPSKPWEYLFYLDFEHPSVSSRQEDGQAGQAKNSNGRVEKVIEEIRPHTQILRRLGTYRKGVAICEGEGGPSAGSGSLEVEVC